MKYLISLLAFTLFTTSAAAQSDHPTVQAINQSMRAAQSIAADFTQVYDDGSRSHGKLYIQRPGKMRFDYASDQAPVIVMSSGSAAIFEDKRDWTPEVYPTSSTPLHHLLHRNADIYKSRGLKKITFSGDYALAHYEDESHPEAGKLVLKFDRTRGHDLVGWTSYPESGEIIEITLTNVFKNPKLDRDMFDRDEVAEQHKKRR